VRRCDDLRDDLREEVRLRVEGVVVRAGR